MHKSARRALCITLGICVSLPGLLHRSALALIISSSEDLSVTESDPASLPAYSDFPYWGNIGWRGMRTSGTDGSAVYLGNSWVLTADHVRAGEVRFDDTTYTMVPGSEQQIDAADLLVFRIVSPPDLPSVPIREAALTDGTDLLMFGTGLTEAETRTYWEVDNSVNPWTWDPNGSSPNASGYEWGASRVKRWGTNEVSDAAGTTSTSTENFLTSFDEGDTTYEAHAADKDSAGAAFVKSGGTWELAGVTIMLLSWPGQPSRTAVDSLEFGPVSVGGGQTVLADVTHYRQAILDATPDLPIVLMGDVNMDGSVDDDDLSLLLSNWGTGATWAMGDLSGDGSVGDDDLSLLLSNWGAGPPPAPTGAGVPEPTAAVIVVLGAVLLLVRRRRRF